MRIEVETINGDIIEGSVAHKDESFIFLKCGNSRVKVVHWSHIKPEDGIRRINKGIKTPLNIEVFQKIRE